MSLVCMDSVLAASPLPPELRLALGAVFRAHVADVLALACRACTNPADAADITHETFLALVEAIASGAYDPAEPAWIWLRSTASRIADRHNKRQTRRLRVAMKAHQSGALEMSDAVIMGDMMDLEGREEFQQRWAIALELLGTLSPDRRIVYVMYELEEMTTAEIADVLGLPAATVRNRLRLAREDIAAALSRWRARQRRSTDRAGAMVLPLDAARLLRSLPAFEVSAEHRGRLWQRLQGAIGALPVSVPSASVLGPLSNKPSTPAPEFLRTPPRRFAVAVLLLVLGVAVGLLIAWVALRSPLSTPTYATIVRRSAPVETTSVAPDAPPPAPVTSAAPAAAASAPPRRAAPDRRAEGRLLVQARAALRQTPPDAAAAIEALATRARLYGTKTALQDEATAVQKQAEALRQAAPASP